MCRFLRSLFLDTYLWDKTLCFEFSMWKIALTNIKSICQISAFIKYSKNIVEYLGCTLKRRRTSKDISIFGRQLSFRGLGSVCFEACPSRPQSPIILCTLSRNIARIQSTLYSRIFFLKDQDVFIDRHILEFNVEEDSNRQTLEGLF